MSEKGVYKQFDEQFVQEPFLPNAMGNNKRQQKEGLRRIWVIGGGKFGGLAVSRILRRFPGARITVVDSAPPDNTLSSVTQIVADGVNWLNQMLTLDAPVDVIVPAIPVHLAARWITLRLGETFDVHPVLLDGAEYEAWLSRLPHPILGLPGQVFVSHADFICPDNCPEPADQCTVTKKPRPANLFDLLYQLAPAGICPVVLRSRQLLAGVGGFFPEDMVEALETVRQHADHPIMMATACRCHGVIDVIRLVPKPTQRAIV